MPRIDPRGVTFEWVGEGHQVVVTGTWCGWRADTGVRLQQDHDGVWRGFVALPPEAYVEYRIMVDGEPVADPTSRHRTDNGFDGANEQLWMPSATRRALDLRRRRGPRGRVERGHVDLGWMAAAPKRRRLDLYLPPGVEPGSDAARALPLLVVLDGPDYLDRGRLDRTLDGLIADEAMAPIAAAFVANAGPSRGSEYAGNDLTLASLIDDVVAAAAERLGLQPPPPRPGERGPAVILGSSMGGLMALHAAIRRPDVFGGVIAQSVAAFPSGEMSTVLLVRHLDPPPIRVWQDAGDHEWLAEANDELAALLAERGYEATYRRQHGGHDQTSWNESLVDALPAMFPATRCASAPPVRPGRRADGTGPNRTAPLP